MPAVLGKMITTRTITSLDEFNAVKPAWDSLLASSGFKNPFLSSQWLAQWIADFGAQENWAIIIAEENSAIHAAMPIIVRNGGIRTLFQKRIAFIGDPWLADYMNVLMSDDTPVDVLADLLSCLQRNFKWGKCDLKPFHRGDIDTAPLIAATKKANLYHHVYIHSKSPQIILSDTSWEDYYKTLPKNLRQDLRTSANRLEKEGKKIEFQVLENANDINDAYETLVTFHQARQKYKVGPSLFDDKVINRFLRTIAHDFSVRKQASVSILKIDGTTVSCVYGLCDNDRYYYWIPSFSMDHTRISLGKLHLMHLIEQAFKDGKKIFDFMIGDEDYKKRWTELEVDNQGVFLYRSRFMRQWDQTLIRIRTILKDIKNKSRFLTAFWIKFSKKIQAQ